jgi:transcriptional regulator with XRE-family HTH domain
MDGLELRERRLALALTQAELAARLEVDARTISNWECGARPIVRAAALDAQLRLLERRYKERLRVARYRARLAASQTE